MIAALLQVPADAMLAVVKGLGANDMLILRAACKRFRAMAPIESVLPGFQPDTLEWMVRGMNVNWNEHMDTPDLRVRYRVLPLVVDVGRSELAPAKWTDGSARGHTNVFNYCIRKGDGDLVIYRAMSDDPDEKLSALCLEVRWPLANDYFMCGVGYYNEVIVLVTVGLKYFVLNVRETDVEMAEEFQRVLTAQPVQTLVKKNFPERMNWFNTVKKCVHQLNTDMWLLTENNHRERNEVGAGTVVWMHEGVFEMVCTGVEDLYVVDDMVLILKTEGTMWTCATDGRMRKITAFGDMRIAAFTVTLDLSCMWVRFVNDTLIRRGGPFELPVGGVRDECTETVALLKAKLARAERRIERLMNGIK